MHCPYCSAPGVSLQEGICYACGREVRASDLESAAQQHTPDSQTAGTGGDSASVVKPAVPPVVWPVGLWLLVLLVIIVELGSYTVVATLLGVPFNNPAVLASIIGGSIALVLLPVLFWYSSVTWRMARRMLAGDYLVRWPYSDLEWLDVTRRTWKRAQAVDGLICLGLFLAVLGIWDESAKISSPGVSAVGLAFGIIELVSVVGFAILLLTQDYQLYRKRLGGSGEVLVSRNAILGPEGCILLSGLERVALEEGVGTVVEFHCVSHQIDP